MGLNLNSSKTTAIMFTKKDVKTPILKINTDIIKFEKQVTFLGTVFDSRLLFDKQIDTVEKKAKGK